MITKLKWVKFISVILLVTLACLTRTDLVFAGIDKLTHSDPDLGTTESNNTVSSTAVNTLSSNLTASRLVNTKIYLSARDKIKSQNKMMFSVDQTSTALFSRIGLIELSR